MACGPRTSQDPERMDLVRENQLRGCPSISLQRIWKIWQPNWECRPDRLKTFRFERRVLSCQSGKSQAAPAGRRSCGRWSWRRRRFEPSAFLRRVSSVLEELQDSCRWPESLDVSLLARYARALANAVLDLAQGSA